MLKTLNILRWELDIFRLALIGYFFLNSKISLFKTIAAYEIYEKYHKRGGNPAPTGSISKYKQNKAKRIPAVASPHVSRNIGSAQQNCILYFSNKISLTLPQVQGETCHQKKILPIRTLPITEDKEGSCN